LKILPKIGNDVYRIAKRSEESFKTFVTPGMLFEAFNFDYFGPIDGHNLNHLIDILKNIKHPQDPVLLHVITKKGKGYEPAEKNPVYFHGVGSFTIDTGKANKKPNGIPSYTQVFGSQMVKLAQNNEKIVAVTAAMPEGTGLIEFSKLYPDRFFDVGIAEQHAVTFSAGLAVKGLKPVIAIYSTFLQRAFDQILHDVCIEGHHVVFAIDRGGVVGEDGPTHHGLFDFSYLRCMPKMTVMAPKDENELARMLVTAVNHDGPVALRYPRGIGTGVMLEDNPEPLEIGKAEVIDQGDDILIIAIGKSVCEALKAGKVLQNEGIDTTIINARFVKPLDSELIVKYAKKIKKIITVEEHILDGGFGSAVLEMLIDKDVTNICLKRVGIKDRFVEHGPQDILKHDYEIDYQAVIKAAIELHGTPCE